MNYKQIRWSLSWAYADCEQKWLDNKDSVLLTEAHIQVCATFLQRLLCHIYRDKGLCTVIFVYPSLGDWNDSYIELQLVYGWILFHHDGFTDKSNSDSWWYDSPSQQVIFNAYFFINVWYKIVGNHHHFIEGCVTAASYKHFLENE